MSEPKVSSGAGIGGPDRSQMMSALFASLVVNQARMALMLLGKVPHPETGQTVKDLEGARMFIDQLEMIEEKTKGNLDQHERKLLRDNLTALQMAFVEAVEAPEKPSESQPVPPAGGPGETEVSAEASSTSTEADSRKKFTKKY